MPIDPMPMSPSLDVPQIQNPNYNQGLFNDAAQLNELKMAPLKRRMIQQQMQVQNLEMQQKRMDIASQQGMMKAYLAAGGDPDKMAQIAPQYNVLPKDILGLRTNLLNMAKVKAETDKDQGAITDQRHDMLNAAYTPAFNETDPLKQKALVSDINQSLIAKGFRPEELIQYTGPDSLKQAQAAYTTHQWITSQAASMRGQAATDQAATASKREEREQGKQSFQEAISALGANPPANANEYQQRVGKLPYELANRIFSAVPPGQYDPAKSVGAIRQLGMTPEQQTQAQTASVKATTAQTEAELARVATDPTATPEQRGAAEAALKRIDKSRRESRPVVNIQTAVPGLGTPQTPGTAQLSGEDYLATLPPATANQVKAIVEGRAALPSASSRSQAAIQLRQAAFQADPTLSEQRAQVRKAFTTGPDGRNVRALNTASVHLDALGEAAQALDNGDIRPGNQLVNFLKTAMGSAAPTNFESMKNAVAGEMANALKGLATDPEIANISKTIQASNSPKQLAGMVETNLGLLRQKLQSYQESYAREIPGDQHWSPIFPSAKTVFDKHAAQQAGPGAPAIPAAIPSQYRSTAHYSPSRKLFYYSTDGGKSWQTARP